MTHAEALARGRAIMALAAAEEAAADAFGDVLPDVRPMPTPTPDGSAYTATLPNGLTLTLAWRAA